jgi:hypothetical protein
MRHTALLVAFGFVAHRYDGQAGQWAVPPNHRRNSLLVTGLALRSNRSLSIVVRKDMCHEIAETERAGRTGRRTGTTD